MRGVVLVATGQPARAAAERCLASLRRHHDWPAQVTSDLPVAGAEWVKAGQPGWGGRGAKLGLLLSSPFDETLYLDADTRVRGDLSGGFAVLAGGWDLALAPSSRQGGDLLGNLAERDRAATLADLGSEWLLGLQCGVLFWRRCQAVTRLAQCWLEEWARFGQHDQGAFLRALYRAPVRLWLLGRAYNGGELVRHDFGAARAGVA